MEVGMEVVEQVEMLSEAMRHIQRVRLADEEVDELFEPLRGSCTLLKKYGIMMPDSTLELLDKAPFGWEDTKKLVEVAREQLTKAVAAQAEVITGEANDFSKKVATFCADFRQEAPFGGVPFDSAHDGRDRLFAQDVAR